MSGDDFQDRSFAARLVRKQRALSRPPLQFNLQSLLIGVAFLCCLAWIGHFLIHSSLPGISIRLNLWFLLLWTALLAGAWLANDVWWHIVSGTVGLAACTPLLMTIVNRQLAVTPLTTGWWMSFIFATFANFGGALWCLGNRRRLLALQHIAVFVGSLEVLGMQISS
jgi:hypothetical protein